MYSKVLVPLDGSEEAEKVLPLVAKVVAPDGEIVLFHVVTAVESLRDFLVGEQPVEAERAKMLGYLTEAGSRLQGKVARWRCETVESESVADGISDFAIQEGVDLIAMYTHDRKGLARLVRGSVAERVQRRSPIEVQVFRPRELQAVGPAEAGEDETVLVRRILRQADVFQGLLEGDIDAVAPLVHRTRYPAWEVLGTEGYKGDRLFILVEGEMMLSTRSAVGEITVRITSPGESWPMAALVGDGTLVTSGVSLTDVDVLTIPSNQLADLCRRRPEIGTKVYANIAQLFASRYAKTLARLAEIEEKVLKDADFLANV